MVTTVLLEAHGTKRRRRMETVFTTMVRTPTAIAGTPAQPILLSLRTTQVPTQMVTTSIGTAIKSVGHPYTGSIGYP